MTWLDSVRDWIAGQWLEPTGGFGPTARYRPRLSSPEQLQSLPMFAEIALVTHDALGDVMRLVEAALATVLRGGSRGDAPQI